MLCFAFLVDFPDRASKSWRFLSKKESDWVVRRINNDRHDGNLEAFSLKKFLKPALDPKIWGFALIFLYVKAPDITGKTVRANTRTPQLPYYSHLRNRLFPPYHPDGRYEIRRRQVAMPCSPAIRLRRNGYV